MRTLILIDLQNDFCPGGALAVPEGDQVIEVANRLQERFDLVVATQDWHPADHASFAANHRGKHPGEVIELDGLDQMLWPVHCVQDTAGAALHPHLGMRRIARVFRKGTDSHVDSYSGFFDNGRRRATGLDDFLKARGTTELFLCGLATDYCVRFTATDAVQLGYATTVIEDACRGVNLRPRDAVKALRQMRSDGASIVRSETLRS